MCELSKAYCTLRQDVYGIHMEKNGELKTTYVCIPFQWYSTAHFLGIVHTVVL